MKGSLRLSTYNMIAFTLTFILCSPQIMNTPAIVYLITGPTPADSYVGCTQQGLAVRLQKHKSRARTGARPRSRLYNAMRARGVDNYTITPLITVDPADRDRAEREQILALNTHIDGLNFVVPRPCLVPPAPTV